MSTNASPLTYAQVASAQYRKGGPPSTPALSRSRTNSSNSSRTPFGEASNRVPVTPPSALRAADTVAVAVVSDGMQEAQNVPASPANDSGKVIGRWSLPRRRTSGTKKSAGDKAVADKTDAGKNDVAATQPSRPPTRQAAKNAPACECVAIYC